jgi:predicted RNA-binding protein with PIN domain
VWARSGGGDDSGHTAPRCWGASWGRRPFGGHLSDATGVIRPAVEAALEVARKGLLANPSVDAPSGLRRYLGFTKLSAATLRAIARVVESDDEFRARVAAKVDEKDVGRAGWLWLTRPDGWSEEVERLQHEADAAASAVAAERSERSARRKLKAAREAADKAAAKARAHAEETDKLRSGLAEERVRRTEAEDERDRLAAELKRASEERARAVRELKDVEARLAARATEANQAVARIRQLEAELVKAGEPAGKPGEAPRHRDVDPRARAALADALRQTADGARSLGNALTELATLLDRASIPDVATTHRPEARARETERSIGRSDVARAGRRSAASRSWESQEPRLPIALPGGIADDSVEAALHLLKTTDVLVLVDGYNVTMAGWPELPIAEQRARLLSALDEAAARSGADVEVIFDGAETDPAVTEMQSGRQAVRKRFSPPDVEADDVLLSLLAQIPTMRPVVVVSSDNRVREGARRQGANLIHARQVMELLRR